MTYQHVSKLIIQIAITVMVALFVWVSYHQLMSTMDMESMPDCSVFCLIATQIDITTLAQSLYYSSAHIIATATAFLIIGVWSYTLLCYLSDNRSITGPPILRLRQYFRDQRWKLNQFSLWSRLYQHGVIAPQFYS